MGDQANVAIGEQDAARDRRMIDEQWKRQDQERGPGSDPFVKPGENETAPVAADQSARHERDDWHPGDAEQPDRAESEGLTGLGPAQPE